MPVSRQGARAEHGRSVVTHLPDLNGILATWRWYEREGFAFEKEEVNSMTGFMMKRYRWRKDGTGR